MIDDMPKCRCPKCGHVQPDHDGFGCLKCERCDFCAHPASTANAAGVFICDLCGKPTPGAAEPKEPDRD